MNNTFVRELFLTLHFQSKDAFDFEKSGTSLHNWNSLIPFAYMFA